MKNNKTNVSLSRFEVAIGYLLITGVILSLILEVAGIGLLYHSYSSFDICYEPGVYIKGHDFFSFVYEQIKNGEVSQNAILCIISGLIILILTPYLRVIASVIYFAWQNNLKYMVITLFVLIVVTLSLTLH